MKNKVVIITGGSRGIGAGISKAFHEQEAKIVINYHKNAEAAMTLASELKGDPESILLVGADISTQTGRSQLLNETIAHFGCVHTLVNNAGIVARGGFIKGTEEEFDIVINTNLKGPVFLAQLCAKYMIEHKIKGSIVNISSVSAHLPNAATSYCASKAGLIAATKNMAFKLGQHGIRVNTVTPGTIRSDMNRRIWESDPDLWKELTQDLPLGRGGEPHELASAVVYLASDESSFITGTELIVDGGWMLKPISKSK